MSSGLRILLLVLAMGLAVGLGGCNRADSENGDDNTEQSDQDTDEAAAEGQGEGEGEGEDANGDEVADADADEEECEPTEEGDGDDHKSGDDDDDDEEDKCAPPIPVEISLAESGSISAFYSGTATLEAEEESLVVAKTGGIVLEIIAEEGDLVKSGDILARLEDDRPRLEMDRARANMSRLENDYKRNEEVYAKQLVSSEEYERVKFEYEQERANFKLAELELSYTRISTPIDGVVSERMIKVGNLVQENAPVFRVTDFDPLLAVLHVPERELPILQLGQPVNLLVDALMGERFQGEVLRISPVVDPDTGTFKVTAAIRDESKRLKPGMFGRVSIVHDVRDNAVLMPKSALIAQAGESAVFVVEDGKAHRRLVETGYTDGGKVEILSGLDSGAQVVTAGHASLKDGARVEVISE